MHLQMNFTIYFVSGKHLSVYLQNFILVRKRKKKEKKIEKKKKKILKKQEKEKETKQKTK